MSGEGGEVRGRFAMNDQQWVMQRKKIGLSRRNKKVLQNKLAAEQQKMSAITISNALLTVMTNTITLPESKQQVRRRKLGVGEESPTKPKRRKYGMNMEENGSDTISWTLFEAIHYQCHDTLERGL